MQKNQRNKKTCLFVNSMEEWKNEGRKPDKDSSLRRLEFVPRNPRLKMEFNNSISGSGYRTNEIHQMKLTTLSINCILIFQLFQNAF
jgi:hypothetical protein